VDAAGWLFLNRVYTSHMTGNTASLARDIHIADWNEAWLHGWPILWFFCGLLYGAATTKAARRRGVHSSFSVSLITECVLLAIVIGMGPANRTATSLIAAAMGIQTVTVTQVNGLRVFTTYLTGSLAKCSEALTDYVFWFRDRTRGRFWKRLRGVLAVSSRQHSLQHAALTAALWVGFLGGAICGVGGEGHLGRYALLWPAGVLVAVLIVDLRCPASAADELPGTSSSY
jgi:uncharacterized membrane protein YoaK (UPF0700 family)